MTIPECSQSGEKKRKALGFPRSLAGAKNRWDWDQDLTGKKASEARKGA